MERAKMDYKCIKIYKAEKEKTLTGHKGIIHAWKFMIGDKFSEPMLVTGSSDRTIKFWKSKKTTSLNWNSEWLWMDATVLDSLIATGHLDGNVRIWSSKQQSLLCKFNSLHTEAVTSLCINPNTCTVISVSKDHSIKMIDYRSNQVIDEVWSDEYSNMMHWSESISWGNYFQQIVVASNSK